MQTFRLVSYNTINDTSTRYVIVALLHHCRVLECLGSGAFGIVNRGVWNQVTQEEVAVKTMTDGASEEERVKFLQEAAIMGQFNHPNIIRLLGIIAEDDQAVCAFAECRSELPQCHLEPTMVYCLCTLMCGHFVISCCQSQKWLE